MKMQEITPLLKIVDAKYKKDPKRANIEKMKLFKEKGTNPLSGCLPILIQLPFLFGMFNLLRTTFELRGVSFIPGWIDNLTSPDILFSWNYPLFFIGTEFHLLPILLGVVMFVQSKMNMRSSKKGDKLTDQQKQQKIMTYLMPILFVVLFYKAASGLNIYFLCSMFLGILQQLYMTKTKKIAKL
jgi:YidC/Oxa1 family membrane protein insertase